MATSKLGLHISTWFGRLRKAENRAALRPRSRQWFRSLNPFLVRSRTIPQWLKPKLILRDSASLKRCPDTNRESAKEPVHSNDVVSQIFSWLLWDRSLHRRR